MKAAVIPFIVDVPSTVEDWQLYADLDGADLVAGDLTRALLMAVQMVAMGGTVSDALNVYFNPVAKKFSKFGALDTESYAVALETLRLVKSTAYALKSRTLLDNAGLDGMI